MLTLLWDSSDSPDDCWACRRLRLCLVLAQNSGQRESPSLKVKGRSAEF